MGSINDLKAVAALRRQERAGRRATAEAVYIRAKAVAHAGGLLLRECAPGRHYQLLLPHRRSLGAATRHRWLFDIYPGNCRIYVPESHKAHTPRLKLDPDWGLVDAVVAAVALLKEGE